MANIVIADLKRPKSRGGRALGSVREKRVRNSEGKVVRVLSLDANSATFIDDLTTVFEKNVRKARQENKRLFGSADGSKLKTTK
jgi:hypothetical protein